MSTRRTGSLGESPVVATKTPQDNLRGTTTTTSLRARGASGAATSINPIRTEPRPADIRNARAAASRFQVVLAAVLITAGLLIACLQYYITHFQDASSKSQVTEREAHMAAVTQHMYDVIIIGGGLAGLAAAIEADRTGANSILLVEKEKQIGGNSAKASSGINAVRTQAQRQDPRCQGDNESVFFEDTLNSGDYLSDRRLVEVLTEQSPHAVEFLEQFDVNLDKLSQCGGHSFPRTHRSGPPKPPDRPTNIGFGIISKLKDHVLANPKIKVQTESRVKRLLQRRSDNKEKVVGVEYLSHGELSSAYGKSIVLASGGYAADRKGLLKLHAPKSAHLPTTNGPWAEGDGIKLGADVGGEPVHLDKVQVHPTGFVNPKDPFASTKILAAEALRGEGGILVNSRGERFVNELARRDIVTDAIFSHCSKLPNPTQDDDDEEELKRKELYYSYLILNEKAKDGFGPAIGFYLKMGLFQAYEDAEAFARAENVPIETVRKTLEAYAAAAAEAGAGRRKDTDRFGKTVFPTTFSLAEPLFVAKITPVLHYTMGGLKFSAQGEILSADNSAIPGLYGAGEVTGGLHGGNRLAGNSLLECVVYGRISGQSAAKYALKNS